MSAAPGDIDLELLLTDAEARVPVLEEGLSASALDVLPPAAGDPHGADSFELAAPGRDLNDLPAQRWGVVAPLGEDGDRMLAAIRALIDHRHAQQGVAPRIYRVGPDMDAAAAIRWRDGVLRAEGVPEEERPHYLLILGDLHQVALELQHILANGALVGRLHCPTNQGFHDYAEKVVAREKAEPVARGRALFYTVQDGTSAIRTGYGHLVEPCMAMTRASGGGDDLASVAEIPYSDWGPDDMLAQVGADEPSVLLSLSHGLGAPRGGWRSPEQQRALQGALSMGLEAPLAADAVHQTPFLPGGVWFCVACFAAGTPRTSAFSPWLALLAEHGGDPRVAEAVQRNLPAGDARPFVAALPQTLLANPRGPLAVIGHMDLAWCFSFTDLRGATSRASRVFSTLRALLAGSRVGVAMDALMRSYRETNDDITSRYQVQRDALLRGEPDPVVPRELGRLWMQRNDLRGYVLLGDPAARVPVRSDRPALQDRPPATLADASGVPGAGAAKSARVPEVAATPPAAPPRPRDPASAGRSSAPQLPRPAVVGADASESDDDGAHRRRRAEGAAASVSDPPGPGLAEEPEVARRERAVLAMLRGDETPRAIAERCGLSLEDVFRWLEVYREAGRKALGG